MLKRTIRNSLRVASYLLNFRQSEEHLAAQSHRWWTNPNNQKLPLFQHWSGSLPEEAWDRIGGETYEFYQRVSSSLGLDSPVRRIVEWGCGGGANAIHFAKEVDTFYGVDISETTLQECERQMAKRGLTNFKPILIDTQSPEKACESISEPIDLFLCVYVFELFPSEAYGLKILRIASQLLKQGGVAIVQNKYPINIVTRSQRWGYGLGVANMTSYPIHEFWNSCMECGLTPQFVHLKPKQPLVNDERYAYYFLTKD